MLNPLLVKILWLQRSKWHFAFAGLAFLLGMLFLLIATEVYFDLQYLTKNRERQSNFIIINKPVTLSNTLGLASSEFTKHELDTIVAQPFVKRLGKFEANQFQASLRIKEFVNFFTIVFFESVPDEFVDIGKSDWIWEDESDVLPIMLSEDFLNMYNFGFAISQGLPQVSREAIKMVPMEIIVQGEKERKILEAKVVGFSKRIPSVLVPQRFMEWANQHIAQKPAGQPSRLIIETRGTDDPGLKKFLSNKKYMTNEEQLLSGQTGALLNMVMAITGILGIFLWVLAFVIFSGNFRLIIAESQPEIKLLLELGYYARTIIWHLVAFFLVYMGVLFALVGAALVFIERKTSVYMSLTGLKLPEGINKEVWLGGIIVIGLMILFNILLIFRQFNKKFAI